jgi:hypothetical protein
VRRELKPEHLDDRKELKLVLEIADIVDELKMIRHLIQRQREVLKSLILALLKLNPEKDPNRPQGGSHVRIYDNTVSDSGFLNVTVNHHEGPADLAETIKNLAQGISGASKNIIVSADEELVAIVSELDTMNDDADYAHKMVCEA